jgi:poly-gamma-glutamate synthesis protein (capsule biosynthesis protein)
MALIAGILVVFLIAFFKAEELEKTSKNFAASKSSEMTKEKGKEVCLIFLGDLMTDRYIRQTLRERGDNFLLGNQLSQKLQTADCAIANLEGPITSFSSKSAGTKAGSPENYLFTMPKKETLSFLEKQNIQVVNLGNNHILNFGKEGLERTKKNLDNHQIDYFGDPSRKENYLVKSFNEIRVAFVNYNHFSKNSKLRAIKNLEKAQNESDFSILYAHWGDEYSTSSNSTQQNLAHCFIEKGADLVVGSHPHIIQESEVYRGVKIYYSLGNFVFDQYFSLETQRGLLLEVILQKNGDLNLKETNIKIKPSGQTVLINN